MLGTFTSQALAAVSFPIISTVVPVVKVDITLKFVAGPVLQPTLLFMYREGLVVGVAADSGLGVLVFWEADTVAAMNRSATIVAAILPTSGVGDGD